MGKLTAPPSRLSSLPSRMMAAAPSRSSASRDTAPWRAWYRTARWKALRLWVFARDLFTCAMCGKIEGDTSLLVCDHIEAHRGDERLFWLPTNLQTLCKSPCHDQRKQAMEQKTRHHLGVWD